MRVQSRHSKKLKNSHFIHDTDSIKVIEDYIFNALNNPQIAIVLSQFNEFNVDLKVTNTNKIIQLYHYLNNEETVAHAYRYKTPLITISTDVLRDFDVNSIKDFLIKHPENIDLLNHCRVKFPHSEDIPTQQLMVQFFFFHELGHLILDNHKPEICNSLIKIEEQEPLISQTLQNIEEGFSDLFSCFIMDRLYPDLKLANIYKEIRQHYIDHMSQEEKALSLINPYNISNNFDYLHSIKETDIFNTLFNIAEKNALELLKNESVSFDTEILKYKDLLDNRCVNLSKENLLQKIINQRKNNNSELNNTYKQI